MERTALQNYLDELLETERYRDYSPNGLQVEGRAEIRSVVCGVTASRALLEAAVARDADAVLVHHGYFWRGEERCVTGIRRERLKMLLTRDINLFAYHLPLDAHPELGNNAQLARLMSWKVEGRFADQEIGYLGAPEAPASAAAIGRHLAARLAREPLLVGDGARTVHRLAWCTGAAQGFFEQAIECGADLYVSGEVSEQTVHLAQESGVPFIAAGHHATERYGIHALAAHLASRFDLRCDFVDVANPV